ncbi:MAG: hypothetical protein JOY82_01460 [Streptosporangiaceae bacterium]|nr:hypothetical protein [Streptosporangiaceae bacterium]MBV9853179.1 hypothetical protein [Streptosporangiaceae bacterium]
MRPILGTRSAPVTQVSEAAGEQTARATTRLRRFAATHGPFSIVVLAAVAVRTIVMLGYPPIMWFNDSYFYVADAVSRTADTARPEGYPFLLWLLLPPHSFTLVAVLQAAMGVAMGIAIYALLRRRGLPWWGATLCAVPALFDAYEMMLEHLVASDTLFTFLITGAVVVLCWRDRPPVWAVLGAGLAIGYATVVRSAGEPLLIAVALALLARRAGWRRIVALLAAGVVPIAAYMIWFHGVYGKYAITESQGTFLYGRVSSFAECSTMNPPADLRVLCDPRPPGKRQGAEQYIWDRGTPLAALTGPNSANRFTPRIESLTMRFAERAVLAQPLDYAAVVIHDTLRTFGWDRQPSNATGSGPTFQFGETATPTPYWATNYPGDKAAQAIYHDLVRYGGPSLGHPRVVSPWAGLVRAYARFVYLRGTLLAVILLAGAVGVIARWRRWGGLVLLPWLAAVLLVVLPPMAAGFSYRYVAAAVPLACLAAGLAFAGVRGFGGDGERVSVRGWLREHGLLGTEPAAQPGGVRVQPGGEPGTADGEPQPDSEDGALSAGE